MDNEESLAIKDHKEHDQQLKQKGQKEHEKVNQQAYLNFLADQIQFKDTGRATAGQGANQGAAGVEQLEVMIE